MTNQGCTSSLYIYTCYSCTIPQTACCYKHPPRGAPVTSQCPQWGDLGSHTVLRLQAVPAPPGSSSSPTPVAAWAALPAESLSQASPITRTTRSPVGADVRGLRSQAAAGLGCRPENGSFPSPAAAPAHGKAGPPGLVRGPLPTGAQNPSTRGVLPPLRSPHAQNPRWTHSSRGRKAFPRNLSNGS